MGRGDRRTRRGKIAVSSYGNVRPHKIKKFVAPIATVAKPAPAVVPAKTTKAKKSA